MTLTIDSALCTQIAASFQQHENSADKRGAAVVMNYRTGEVLAMVSLPSFDPMNITDETRADAGKPFWNRATQSVYAPGSTFKIITAASGLKNIDDITTRDIACNGTVQVGGVSIRDYGSAIHGTLDLKRAFTVSCNNAFAQLALALGDDRLKSTAVDFGFNDNFLFRDLVVENSSYPTQNRTDYEVAASGFGQSAITATPMHMCMVAAAVANDGVMMEPRLLKKVTGASGGERLGFSSNVYRTALSGQDAATLKDYMRAVVTGGTGTRAAVSGLAICGKTGTAEASLDGEDISNAWFVGFIDDDTLPFAVAVIVEQVDDGLGGGSVAAPVAADIFRYLQAHRDIVTD